MLTSRDRILTTHVGSLPRNEVLTDLLIRREAGEAIDAATMAAEMDRAVRSVVEAQIAAGIDLLLTYWFPEHHRARILSSFALALPISVALGAPISTAILDMDGVLGIAGWKWIYLIEAVPTVLVGIFVLFVLTDRPSQANW